MRVFVVIKPESFREIAKILKDEKFLRGLGEYPPSDELIIEIEPDELNFFPRNYIPLNPLIESLFPKSTWTDKMDKHRGFIDERFVDRTIVQL